MKLINLGHLMSPQRVEYHNHFDSPGELDPAYIKDYVSRGGLPDLELCVYQYWQGSYDGSGSAIVKNALGQWYHVYLSHCSCDGPEANFFFCEGGTHETFSELVNSFSAELRSELHQIIEHIKTLENL